LIQEIPDESLDIIYHDAFSPTRQSELWTQQLFEQYRRVLKPDGGLMITYSASAAIRNGLLAAGLYLYPTESIHFKPGTLAFVMPQLDREGLSERDIALLDTKSGISFQDSPELDWPREKIVADRQASWIASDKPTSSSVHSRYGKV
jgi:hypothetical protein